MSRHRTRPLSKPILRADAHEMVADFLAKRPTRTEHPITSAQARAARVGLGLTPAGLATISGVPAGAIDNFEHGRGSASVRDRFRLQEALEIHGAAFVTASGLQAVVFNA